MLSSSHNRAYQDFSTLLTKFQSFLNAEEEKASPERIQEEWQQLRSWFDRQIVTIDIREFSEDIALRWQSVQTEIKREFKLLSTDVLFFASARQITTQNKRVKSINTRLTKLIDYCQIVTNVAENKS